MSWIPLGKECSAALLLSRFDLIKEEEDVCSYLFAILMCRLHPELEPIIDSGGSYELNDDGTAYRIVERIQPH